MNGQQLSPSAQSVLAYLRKRTIPQKIREIQLATGLDYRRIHGALFDLEELGWVLETRSHNGTAHFQTTFAGMGVAS